MDRIISTTLMVIIIFTLGSGIGVATPTTPVAKFSTNVSEGHAPLSVQFTDLSENNPNKLDWNFGDGTPTSTEQNPVHTYSAAGDYTVTLKATKGQNSNSTLATINVLKPIPTITWSKPADITFGTALSDTQLNANASVPGSFVYNPDSGSILGAGTQTLHTTFTPTDLLNYTTATSNVSLTVNKATPLITWGNPADITYGTPLSETQLNASTSVPGSFIYTLDSGTVLDPGIHTLNVDFTPNDAANYTNATANVTINVSEKPGQVVANFSTNVSEGYAPLSVQFTDLSENATGVSWDFNGDGVSDSDDRNPIHEFTTARTYIVNLTATNGTYIDSKFATINVLGHSYNYTFKDSDAVDGPTYDWIEISETGNQILNNSDDSVEDNVDLGFFFRYYGTYYRRLAISNNGLLFSLGAAGNSGNYPIGQSPNVHGFISPYWDDLVTLNGGKIYYQTLGTAPNRIFVTEWVDNQYFPRSDSGITFESILYEGSNNIKFQYKDVSFGNNTSSQYDNGGSATVGIESPEGTDGLQYSFNAQVIDSGKAILFMSPQFTGVPPIFPVANFSSNVSEGYAPLDVHFTDLSENATGWSWDFENDAIPDSIDRNPVHEFTSHGTYKVNLTVSNGNSTDSTFATITVSGTHAENYTFVTTWGSYGNGSGQFNGPGDAAVDSSGNIYVADTYNHRIQKFDSSSNFITYIGDEQSAANCSRGSGDGQFNEPWYVAVDSSDNIYVADSGNHRIQKFNSSGAFITKWGSLGSDDGQFSYPQGVAIDSVGNVYVADASNSRIQKFDSSGTFLITWGSLGRGDGQLNNPWDVATDSLGNVYVTDTYNNRIQKFDSNGIFLTKWGSYGIRDGQFYSPSGVAVDSLSNVYVADTENNRIQKFDSNGALITHWGSEGSDEGQFYYPNSVAVDSSDSVYVADYGNNRIQKFAVKNDLLPIANFSSNVSEGYAPLTVQFTDLSENATAWNWDFGDNTNSTDQSPMHTYSAAGNYVVNLTVANNNGTDLETAQINVSEMSENPDETVLPEANFSTNVTEGYAPLTVQFTDLSKNVTGWNWDFGDKTNSTDQNPVHIYDTAGNYTVNLTATNQKGTDSKLATINVTASQVIPPQSISDIQSSPESTWINWTWTNPNDPNFNHTEIYLNGTFQANTSAEYFNATDLQPETDYTIGTRTADIYGNINKIWVNASAKTKPLPDADQPVIESVVLFPANTTAGSKIKISANITDNIGVAEVTAGDIQLMSVGGDWQGNITAPSSSGKYFLSIRAKDSAGNTVNTSVPYSVVRRNGGVNAAVLPTVSKVAGGKSTALTIKVKNTQNIDDTFKVQMNVDGLPAFYRAGDSWFNWTEKTVNLRAKQEVIIPVEVKVPTGTVTGLKVLKASVDSEKFPVHGSDKGYLIIPRPHYINKLTGRFNR